MIYHLPWAPTVNKYWTPRKGGGKRLTDKARAYRQEVWLAVMEQGKEKTITRLVQVTLSLYMPDKRRRDIDNLPKGIFDGLTHARVWEDDMLVDDYRVRRVRDENQELIIVKGGKIIIEITEI